MRLLHVQLFSCTYIHVYVCPPFHSGSCIPTSKESNQIRCTDLHKAFWYSWVVTSSVQNKQKQKTNKIHSLLQKNIDFLSTKYFKVTSWEVRACRCLISPVQCNIIQTFWIYLRSEWALGVDTHAATWPIIKIIPNTFPHILAAQVIGML